MKLHAVDSPPRARPRAFLITVAVAAALAGAGPASAIASGKGGGGGAGGGGAGGGGGKTTLPLLISQTYTFDTNPDGSASTTTGVDRICRLDGFVYASTGSSCVTDSFSTDQQGTKQLVYSGEIGQAWVDKLNAWNTDPARRVSSGKQQTTVSLTCLTTLFVVDPTVQPTEAGLNPVCLQT